MPTRDDQGATVVVIELGSGKIYVKIAEPRPERQLVETLLRKTVRDWFEARPQFVIDRLKPVLKARTLLGILVWYHVEERREVKSLPVSAESPSSLTIEVSEPFIQQMPKERLEAVVDEAVQIWLSQPDRHDTLIVVNARKIAVVLDARANRGAVLSVEDIFAALDQTAREAMRTWLVSQQTRLYSVQIDGSWFQPHVAVRQQSRIAEPNLLRTNLVYDTGKGPGG